MKVIIQEAEVGLELSLEPIGEGYSGDYDPDDPGDAELLRLDIAITSEAAEHFEVYGEDDGGRPGWFLPDKTSYCTGVRADLPLEDLTAKAAAMARRAFIEMTNGRGLKSVAQDLSWFM
jgi:hypothetical protein